MSVFDALIGQPRVASQLLAATDSPVHAYLFVGRRGTGKRKAAALLAGEVVGTEVDRERNRGLALREEHPDLVIFEPEGVTLRAEEVESIIVEGSRSSVEAGRKVIVVDRFHEASAEAAARLLKPIEEPPPSTIFVLLAESVPPEHITIASRSTTIEFPAVSVDAIREALLARGVASEVAESAAVGSGGDIGRAELLVTDDMFFERRKLWWDAPNHVGGSGHNVAELASKIIAAIDEARKPLDAQHLRESEQMDEQEALTGQRGSGRKAMQERHRREARMQRTDEWRMGLATLAQRYRAEVRVDEAPADSTRVLGVFEVLNDATNALVRNPNDVLWLHALLLRLPRLT